MFQSRCKEGLLEPLSVMDFQSVHGDESIRMDFRGALLCWRLVPESAYVGKRRSVMAGLLLGVPVGVGAKSIRMDNSSSESCPRLLERAAPPC